MSEDIRELKREANSFSYQPHFRPFPLRENETLKFLAHLERESETVVLLESLGVESDNSRYTFISAFPKRVLTAKGKRLESEKGLIAEGNPYQLLSEIFPPKTSYLEATESGGGGLYGYLSYEAINDMEPGLKLKEHLDFPKFRFAWMEDGVLIDRRTGESKYFFYGTDRFDMFERIYHTSLKDYRIDRFRANFLGDSRTKEDHRLMVEEVMEEIQKGNTFQCQIGFKKSYESQGSDISLYESLRKVNPSPFMFYLKFGTDTLLGASPELLFRLKDGFMESFPLAGTIRRGSNEEEDRSLALRLLSDPKEIAEHNMLVDLHRNDLGRVAKFGTVKVRDSFALKRFSHVQHLSTEISGIIRPGLSMFSALASSFPTGTLSGAPKVETMKIIEKVENDPRGPYGGAVGRFGFDGNCSFCIPIRSYFRSSKGSFIRASGGIVYDSDPEYEYSEIIHKMGAVLKAMEVAI
ncbi:anthranilate synthase component I [Leptospira perolatii]|uniref:Anthranilate synthase component I n=1 Tax=Leptospira perolatii TaxID=2023191 RepID=A0A2M9ZIR0_9LEPT|nr:anthranilate synthase component I family protein [Leptospira perolatii]PJZ68471.1 anthranilate synthase component I [Leptospira perolatii]PJZ71901.1 anthranilate synthase component I [Leptospira perolatii]